MPSFFDKLRSGPSDLNLSIGILDTEITEHLSTFDENSDEITIILTSGEEETVDVDQERQLIRKRTTIGLGFEPSEEDMAWEHHQQRRRDWKKAQPQVDALADRLSRAMALVGGLEDGDLKSGAMELLKVEQGLLLKSSQQFGIAFGKMEGLYQQHLEGEEPKLKIIRSIGQESEEALQGFVESIEFVPKAIELALGKIHEHLQHWKDENREQYFDTLHREAAIAIKVIGCLSTVVGIVGAFVTLGVASTVASSVATVLTLAIKKYAQYTESPEDHEQMVPLLVPLDKHSDMKSKIDLGTKVVGTGVKMLGGETASKIVGKVGEGVGMVVGEYDRRKNEQNEQTRSDHTQVSTGLQDLLREDELEEQELTETV